MEQLDAFENDAVLANRKTYYSISEVCEQTGLEPHVLRYWESEFPQLRPKKNRAGNRAYRDKDIEIIREIKRLLYEERFTIPGAKKRLCEEREKSAESRQAATVDHRRIISETLTRLKSLYSMLTTV